MEVRNNKVGMDFLSNFGKRVSQRKDYHRKSASLLQPLSVLIQRYNAVSVLSTLDHTAHEYEV